ncbi:MAG: endo-1,4-beta-xylanase [Patescibacteria group bacterium]|nr:endo-1,4-beta-xylanase [Patescibacteria group bacterium]MDE2589150.1 endo-1,4-beta-xylanase [Patescibacteria group bacterium]
MILISSDMQPFSPERSADVRKATGQLRQAAQERHIMVGSAVRDFPLRFSSRYRRLLGGEFNMLTPENAMKWDVVHPQRNTYNFSQADRIVDFASKREFAVRGHTLVWHKALPSWLTKGNFSPDELRSILKDHITTVVGRYKGKVYVWDVLNEIINESGQFQPSIWHTALGEQYIADAFRIAHQADPSAKLFYNEAGAEGLTPHTDAVYELVRKLRSQGVPIHGIGFQMHIDAVEGLDYEGIRKNLERFSKLGLEIHITEMDIKVQDLPGTMEERLKVQAEMYRKIMQVASSIPNFKAWVQWGLTDKFSWITDSLPAGKKDSPLIFDKYFRPKEAYFSMTDTLRRGRKPGGK